jgi:hypothetical protein
VDLLREHGKDSCILSPQNIDACRNEGNRWVQAYRAEEIVISAISKYGFDVIQGEKHTNMIAKPFSEVPHLGLSELASGAYQCIPPPGFQFLDSVVIVIPTAKKEAIKIFAQQTTFSSVADHQASRNFFEKAYSTWETQFPKKPKARIFEWHLVWVLTAKEKKIRHQAKEHGRLNMTKACNFKEWFFSFADFRSMLVL